MERSIAMMRGKKDAKCGCALATKVPAKRPAKKPGKGGKLPPWLAKTKTVE